MKQNLINKLGEFTKRLSNNEEEYMRKYKELVGDDTKYNNLDSKSNLNDNVSKSDNFLKTELTSRDIIAKRENEINNLVNSISELAQIFKDLQTLVLEQGTILDRIDYNIDTAKVNVEEGHINIVKADKNMHSSCARNTNMMLIFIIFIMGILTLFKYF
jgi:syntaxin 16